MKKQTVQLLLGLAISAQLVSCGSRKNAIRPSDGSEGVGDTRTETVRFYDDHTYLVIKPAADSTYGLTPKNPVCVGGMGSDRPIDPSRFYLNALLGPNGEKVNYFRYGSCCSFKTPNGMINNIGLLDRYGVYWEGSDTLSVFINIYDEGNLFVPVGFKSKQ